MLRRLRNSRLASALAAEQFMSVIARLLFTLILFAGISARAQNAIEFGHDLTQTSEMMNRGVCTAGLVVAGCGVDDRWSLATSPWLLHSYHMGALFARILLDEKPGEERTALQVGYLKTFKRFDPPPIPDFTSATDEEMSRYLDDENRDYDMEAYSAVFIRTYYLAPHVDLHFNQQILYFANQRMPYSLRRPSTENTPWQVNSSLLIKLRLVDGWELNAEGGILDWARKNAYFHNGGSLGRRTTNWMWHLGFSITGSLFSLFHPVERFDYQQNLKAYSPAGYDSVLSDELVKYDFALHQEFSVQYFF